MNKISTFVTTVAIASVAYWTIAMENYVPIDWSAEPETKQIAELRRLRVEKDFNRFVLVAPFNRERAAEQDLTTDYFAEIGRSIARAKAALVDLEDVKIGWWMVPTLSHASRHHFQCITDLAGHESSARCPLDEAYIADFTNKVVACCREALPYIMFFEDDYNLCNHSCIIDKKRGCFCPLHLKKLSKRVGRPITKAEMMDAYNYITPENEPLRQAYAEVAKASLVDFAKATRAAIDSVDSKIRTCLCQSVCVDMDGDITEDVAKAFAGSTRPLVRAYGSLYSNENAPCQLPKALAHFNWTCSHVSDAVDIIHETDAYPHTRFFNSSLLLISELSAGILCGAKGSYYYCTMYTDDLLGDGKYANRYLEYAARLEALRKERVGMTQCGVRGVYNAKEVYLVHNSAQCYMDGSAGRLGYFLGKLGFPLCFESSASVSLMFVGAASVLSDDEIKRELSRGILIDGLTALALTKRGFAKYLGCEAIDDKSLKYVTEEIEPRAGCKARGRKLHSYRFPGPTIPGWNDAPVVRLKALPDAEVWSSFCGYNHKQVSPSVTYFENELGGRVGVMALPGVGQPLPAIYNPRKQELLRNLFAKLTGKEGLDVIAPKTPSTWLLAAKKEGELLFMAENLAGEPLPENVFEFGSKWRGKQLERLNPKGEWESVGLVPEDGVVGYSLLTPLAPEFFRVK